ncbi:MAG TPA: MBL fold metallo-hydrolase, partial [Burkholderiaceae bacterium]|nr:MBL fold metallo-hydrolase [Burkholderiaceae bacterium]
MNKITVVVLAAVTAWFAGPSFAQQPAGPPVGPDWSKIEVKTTDLGNRTYMLEGFGGNVTIAAGDDGVIMVDGQFAPMHDKLKTAIEAVSSQPIRFLVNTHYHPDHVGGNALFNKDGAIVVAHENTRKHLAEGATRIVPEVKYAPAPEEMLPTITHTKGMSLAVKGRTAQLKHPENAHTDGDTFVYFADANVL